MKNIIQKAFIIRLIIAIIIMSAIPAYAQAGLIDISADSISSWFKTKLAPVVLADNEKDINGLATINGIALITSKQPLIGVLKVYETYVTAYSSSVDETDSTPFITASGKKVRDGIVAANFLPMGTKIRIPDIFGNKIFVVEDRMARRHADKVDVWFPTKQEAKTFGRKKLQIEVIEDYSL
ncbi:MAG: hypothetical protein Q8Q95_03575 [bacterium]|nr:hypothetical protein [bacterium]